MQKYIRSMNELYPLRDKLIYSGMGDEGPGIFIEGNDEGTYFFCSNFDLEPGTMLEIIDLVFEELIDFLDAPELGVFDFEGNFEMARYLLNNQKKREGYRVYEYAPFESDLADLAAGFTDPE